MVQNELAVYVLSTVIGVLLLCIAALIWTIGRMANKLMSRNYYDYEITRNLDHGQKRDTIKKNMGVEVQDDQSTDDLGYLHGMG